MDEKSLWDHPTHDDQQKDSNNDQQSFSQSLVFPPFDFLGPDADMYTISDPMATSFMPTEQADNDTSQIHSERPDYEVPGLWDDLSNQTIKSNDALDFGPLPVYSETSSISGSGLEESTGIGLKHSAIPLSKPSLSFSEGHDLQGVHSMTISAAHTENWSMMTPLDRWKHSPPELEPAPLLDIMESVANSTEPGPSNTTKDALSSTYSQPHGQRVHKLTASAATSESAGSSVSSSSASSAGSVGSHGSFGCFYASEPTGRRRRRRRRKSPLANDRNRPKTDRRPYQCTFCTDTFKSKYDWTRHERTLHLSLESWMCAPFGPTYQDETCSEQKCTFCDIVNPSESHIQSHRFQECQDKPATLRTFYRKDHLDQHMRLVHGVRKSSLRVKTWKSKVTQVNSRCGFCEKTFIQWPERNDHLAAHFRNGLKMKDWKGCRGLDPAVALAVENAMPPYLIGMESTSMNPFRASRCDEDAKSRAWPVSGIETNQGEDRTSSTVPTPFEKLTKHLIQFVKKAQAAGISLTDENIQEEARCFVFGDDDPWNQTAADNQDWLKLFREGMGLDSTYSIIHPDQLSTINTSDMPPSSVFPLPWSVDTASWVEDAPSISDPANIIDPWMPWSWHTPECLVEFRRQNHSSGPCTPAKENAKSLD
ncbi:hypothetical protein L228DRAFT_282314 [Xylona heveae TC161]|uniref:C2H2-type domain-containing protein n=1 Tax=Xylona heveae (strain CBS 132557 / TC161) TaxID=1328760 RepID=A0A161TCS2_XYLHT|nr:hypothetical protein L228DRAFT_282314 [Xylona heveae TC161]KZF23607.1 hypothetical protein L228DRAFT_282314 [Xylona heveae TC161]